MPRMRTLSALIAGALAIAAPVGSASAQLTTYSDHASFISATGAVDRAALTNAGLIPGAGAATYLLDGMTFSIVAPSTSFYVGTGTSFDWSGLISGHEIAISGPENLNVTLAEPAYAIGFHYADPTSPVSPNNGGFAACSSLCPCQDTVFDATLRSMATGGAVVGTFTFQAPRDTAGYVGVSSALPFDRLEIRERGSSCDNEYFGRFAVSASPPPPPPCPADFNADGNLDPDDLSDYITCFFASAAAPGSCPEADFNADGAADPDDLSDFITAFFAGCP